MNNEMAREIRTDIIKYYKIKYFHDFTNYVISMEEMVNITEHCLIEPTEKMDNVRSEFAKVIKNFEDIRNFKTVNRCLDEIPDEVAAAHCILHQAVLFNETMQESLVTIVEIKTRQHAQDMNSTLYSVQKCLHNYVPHFFKQLLTDAYTSECPYLKVINTSVGDLIKDKWRDNSMSFRNKWSPLVKLLKTRNGQPLNSVQEPLLLTLFSANLTTEDIVRTLY